MKVVKFKKIRTDLLIVLGAFVLAVLLTALELAQMVELKTLDARFKIRGPIAVSDSDIAIVGIDDRS